MSWSEHSHFAAGFLLTFLDEEDWMAMLDRAICESCPAHGGRHRQLYG